VPKASLSGPSIPDLMGRLGGAIKAGSTETMHKAAAEAKKIHTKQLAKAIGPDLRMSNVGRKGARLSIYYKVDTRGEVASATVAIRGPAHLIERPTKPHGIYPKGSRGVSRRKTERKLVGPVVVNTKTGKSNLIMPPARGYRRSAMHPGTKGEYPFALGQKAAEGAVLRIVRGNIFAVIKSGAGVRMQYVGKS